MRLERANSKRPVTWLSFIGVVLIPIIVAAGFILATWKSTDRLDTIEAAIVNNDDGAKVNGETVPIGRQLTGGLVGEKKNNVHWVISDEDRAKDGLADGTYAAVLTIPKGFSQAVTSVDDAETATQTQIDVDVSGVSPATDTLVSESVAEVARTTFNKEMTKTFLDNVFVGFNKMGTQLRDLGDAAGELDDGADELTKGTDKAASGAGDLSDGMQKLDSAGTELNSGAGDLASGVGDLAKGTSQLDDGVQQMKKQTKDLPENTDTLASGAGDLSDGVDKYTKSIDKIIEGFSGGSGSGSASGSGAGGSGGFDDLISGGKDLEKGAAGVSTGASGLSTGLQTYQDKLQKGADQADQLAGSVTGLDDLVNAGMLDSSQADRIRAQLCPPGTPDEVCAGTERAYALGLLNGTSGGLNTAASGLETKDPTTKTSLLGGADDLADGAAQLSDGVGQFVDGLEDGLGELFDGMDDLAKNAPQLLEASKGLRKGASGLADGTDQLAKGMPALTDGISQTADGTSQLSDGASQLDEGVGTFTDGLDQYVTGVSTAATGTAGLSDGLDGLATGTKKLDDGIGKFADGVKKGAKEVPSYTAPERDRLSTVAAANIKAPATDSVNTLFSGSTIGLLVMMALWIGGLVTYTVLKPIPSSTLLSTKSSFAVWLRGLWPGLAVGAVQAIVVAILTVTVMDIDAAQGFEIAVLGFASALVFMLLNFALVAWFGGVGRFLSIIAVVLAVAGRVIGSVPEFFHVLAPILPLTPSMNGFAAIAAGVDGLGAAYAGLLAWAIIGAVMSLLAIVRARTTKPEEALAMA